MNEISKKVAIETLKITPAFARERISNAILGLFEKNAVEEMGQLDFDWYRRHAHGWKSKSADLSPSTSMGLEERVWYLLESTPDKRKDWKKLIGPLSTFQLQDLAKVFDYREPDYPDHFLSGASEVRSRFFQDFIKAEGDEDKKDFFQKYAKATPASGPYIVWGQIHSANSKDTKRSS